MHQGNVPRDQKKRTEFPPSVDDKLEAANVTGVSRENALREAFQTLGTSHQKDSTQEPRGKNLYIVRSERTTAATLPMYTSHFMKSVEYA